MNAARPAPREALLAAIIDAVGQRGLGVRSLRDIAADVGTSHRMLIHHFGSREGLLLAIVTEVEARQLRMLAELPQDPVAAIGVGWQRVSDSRLWPFERLFFECYARAAQGEAPFDAAIPGLVESWIGHLPEGRQRDLARLGLAIIRGLLLDLVATEDRDAVDRAMNAFLDLVSAETEQIAGD